jgi:hypothetical protein
MVPVSLSLSMTTRYSAVNGSRALEAYENLRLSQEDDVTIRITNSFFENDLSPCRTLV